MESRRHPAVVLIALGLLVAAGAPAGALDRDAHATSSDQGVDVIITGRDDAFHNVPSGHQASQCDWSAVPYYDENTPPPSPRPSPEHNAYLVFCDGDFVGIYWLGPRNFGLPDAAAMAGEVVDHVPVDLATIRVRPDGGGVTGIASYFWVEGYSGAPINETVTGLGTSVAVSITLGDVSWSFGDGSPPVSGSLGEAWPARSSVNHTYRDKGLRTVTVTITLPAEFTVNGGVAQQLPPVVRTATLAYQVDEIQAVRDR